MLEATRLPLSWETNRRVLRTESLVNVGLFALGAVQHIRHTRTESLHLLHYWSWLTRRLALVRGTDPIVAREPMADKLQSLANRVHSG